MASKIGTFLVELKRRKVYHVAVAYLVVGFGVASGAQYVFEMLDFPQAAAQFVAILVILGFPIALVLAWAYEVRPDGAASDGLQDETEGKGSSGPSDGASAPTGPPSHGHRQSIVVLPFDNLSPDLENAFFADGLTEELIADLSKLRNLRVTSRTSAFLFRDSGKDVPTIAGELGVRYVLEGSVRRAGSGLRITAQLIDAESDTHLWAEKYSGTLQDVFDLEEQLSRKIVEGLKVPLSEEEDRHLSARPIPNVEAYQHYLRARPNIYAFNSQAIEKAIRELEAGLEILGENVHLLKGLGMAYFQLLNAGHSENPAVVEMVEDCAQRIRAIAPDDADSFLVAGMARIIDSDGPGAVFQWREAYRRNPSDTDILLWLGVASFSTGQLDVSENLIEELNRVDPLAPLSPLLASGLAFYQGRVKDSARLVGEALHLGPDVLVGLWFSVRAYAAVGDHDRSRECFSALKQLEENSPFTESAGVFIRGLDGKTDHMPEPSPGLRTWAARDGEWAQGLSDAYAFAGDAGKALEWLELARQGGFYNHIYMTEQNPFVHSLKDHPEWEEVIGRMRDSHRRFEKRLRPMPWDT